MTTGRKVEGARAVALVAAFVGLTGGATAARQATTKQTAPEPVRPQEAAPPASSPAVSGVPAMPKAYRLKRLEGNANGLIVGLNGRGDLAISGQNPDGPRFGLLQRADGTQVRFPGARLIGVTDDGAVAGTGGGAFYGIAGRPIGNPNRRAFLWKGGKFTYLPEDSVAVALTQKGQLFAAVYPALPTDPQPSDVRTRAKEDPAHGPLFVWEGGKLSKADTPPTTAMHGDGANRYGDRVKAMTLTRADGTQINLASLMQNDAHWSDLDAQAVSDNLTVAGQGRYKGQWRRFLLVPASATSPKTGGGDAKP